MVADVASVWGHRNQARVLKLRRASGITGKLSAWV